MVSDMADKSIIISYWEGVLSKLKSWFNNSEVYKHVTEMIDKTLSANIRLNSLKEGQDSAVYEASVFMTDGDLDKIGSGVEVDFSESTNNMRNASEFDNDFTNVDRYAENAIVTKGSDRNLAKSTKKDINLLSKEINAHIREVYNTNSGDRRTRDSNKKKAELLTKITDRLNKGKSLDPDQDDGWKKYLNNNEITVDDLKNTFIDYIKNSGKDIALTSNSINELFSKSQDDSVANEILTKLNEDGILNSLDENYANSEVDTKIESKKNKHALNKKLRKELTEKMDVRLTPLDINKFMDKIDSYLQNGDLIGLSEYLNKVRTKLDNTYLSPSDKDYVRNIINELDSIISSPSINQDYLGAEGDTEFDKIKNTIESSDLGSFIDGRKLNDLANKYSNAVSSGNQNKIDRYTNELKELYNNSVNAKYASKYMSTHDKDLNIDQLASALAYLNLVSHKVDESGEKVLNNEVALSNIFRSDLSSLKNDDDYHKLERYLDTTSNSVKLVDWNENMNLDKDMYDKLASLFKQSEANLIGALSSINRANIHNNIQNHYVSNNTTGGFQAINLDNSD